MNVDVRPTSFAPGLIQPGMVSCLQNLFAGRVVEIWGAETAPYREEFTSAVEVRSAGVQADGAADILLCLDTERTAEFLSSPVPTAALDAGAIVIAWSAKPEFVELSAPHSAHYLQQAMTAVLVRDAQFARSQVAVLHEAVEEPSAALRLALWSNEPNSGASDGFFRGQRDPFVAQALHGVGCRRLSD